MKKLLIILAFASGMIATYSCSKKSDDKDETPAPSVTAELITGGNSKSWKTVARKENGNPVPVDSCDQDDVLTFVKAGNTGSFDPGAKKCSSAEIAITGTWALSNADKTLSISGNVFGFPVTQVYTIISITATEAVISYVSTDGKNLEDTLNPL